MKTMTRTVFLISLIVLTGMLAGCGDAEAPTMPVRISGSIVVPEGMPSDGKVHVNLYHAWALEGILRHPVEEIESFEATAGAYSHEFAYPPDRGEGLLIYAWLDIDGDGALCAPSPLSRNELSGLTEVQGFPASEVKADIELTEPCAGPDWFYPAAE